VNKTNAEFAYDLVLEDVNKIPFFMPLWTRTPVAVLVPHLFGATIFRETNLLFGAYVWAMERPIPSVYRKSWFLPMSDSTRADLIQRGVAAARAVVVHSGFDFARYDLASPPPRRATPTLVHLGRLMRYKSVDVAVRAMVQVRAVVPQARLAIAGDGPEGARLQRLAQRLGVADAVDFLGYLSHADKVRLLWESHVLLNPSPKEGWGLTVIEANAFNRGELTLKHFHDGVDLRLDWAWETLRKICKIWKRPVHLETILEGVSKVLSFDGQEQKEQRVSGEAR
jgi:glycosyltransferase involved in cell wall biosynthesis